MLRKHRLRLNASKCSFGVSLGKFLGCMITHRRIEVNPDQIKAINDLHPAFYPEWLANTMLVKKKNEKWRMCVDFKDLNKVCPKDLFPFSWIDQLVDATVGHPQMSFLDAFQGYHQIPRALSD